MFEYADSRILVILGIVFTVLLLWIPVAKHFSKEDGKKYKPMFITKLIILLCIVAPLYQSYSAKSNIERNINRFNQGQTLKCSTQTASYLISKESGWKVYSDSFTKDSLLIRGDKCEEK